MFRPEGSSLYVQYKLADFSDRYPLALWVDFALAYPVTTVACDPAQHAILKHRNVMLRSSAMFPSMNFDRRSWLKTSTTPHAQQLSKAVCLALLTCMLQDLNHVPLAQVTSSHTLKGPQA